MTDNPIIAIIAGIGFVVFGIYAILFPLEATKLAFLWPKFIFPKLPGDNVPPKTKEGLDWLYNDPDRYRQEHRNQLRFMRFSGVVAIFIGAMFILGGVVKLSGLG